MQDVEQAIRERAYHMWLDAGRPDGNSDAFWLTAQREVLTVSLGQIASVKPASQKKSAKPKAVFPSDLPAANAGLFDTLRQWRGQTAREQGVPAYVILHDKTLHELAARRPQTMNELLNVAGIGEAKATRYGSALLELLVSAPA